MTLFGYPVPGELMAGLLFLGFALLIMTGFYFDGGFPPGEDR